MIKPIAESGTTLQALLAVFGLMDGDLTGGAACTIGGDAVAQQSSSAKQGTLKAASERAIFMV